MTLNRKKVRGPPSPLCSLSYSSARMHSPSRPWHGRSVSSEKRYGQDGRLRFGDASATGTGRRSSQRARHVSHARIGLSNQKRIRSFFQVHAQSEDGRLLRRDQHSEGRADASHQLPAHRRGHAGEDARSRSEKDAQSETHQAFYLGRVRQDAGGSW